MFVRREFSHESVGETIFENRSTLPKYLSNIKWLPFLRHRVDLFCRVVAARDRRTAVIVQCVMRPPIAGGGAACIMTLLAIEQPDRPRYS